MNGNEVEHIGGILEKPLPLKNGGDLFRHLYKEMKEEAKINQKDLAEVYLHSIIQNQKGSIGFIFKAKLSITAKALKERFAKSKNKDKEIKDLLFLNKKEYINYLETCNRSVKKLMIEMVE